MALNVDSWIRGFVEFAVMPTKKRSLPSQAGFPFKQNETTKIHYAQKQNENLV